MVAENVFIIKDSNHSVGQTAISCKCMDTYTREHNPDCKLCNGTGIMKYLSPEIKAEGGQVLAKAEIVFESLLTMLEDDEPIPVTDMLAYFHADQDVAVGDVVVYKSKNYRVVEREDVIGVANDVSIRCCLEPII